jgi:UDP-glucose 4-epimerase
MKKNLIITGGSGYIGSVLAKNLVKKYSVYILDKSQKNPFIKENIFFKKCNLTDYKITLDIVKKIKPVSIVHLAAQSTLDAILIKKKSYKVNNIYATENIVKVAKELKIKKFIFASTAAVYSPKNLPLKEESALSPIELYGKTKLKNEVFIQKLLNNTLTKFCILRFFNVCSADKKNTIGEFHSPETHLLPIIIKKILSHEPICVYGNNYKTKDGTCIRDYVHVKDIIIGISKSIDYLNKNKSNVFNLGTKKGTSILELINSCSEVLKIKPIIKYKKKRYGDKKMLICDIKKAITNLKWKPVYSGISRIIKDEVWWFNYLNNLNLKRKFIY